MENSESESGLKNCQSDIYAITPITNPTHSMSECKPSLMSRIERSYKFCQFYNFS